MLKRRMYHFMSRLRRYISLALISVQPYLQKRAVTAREAIARMSCVDRHTVTVTVTVTVKKKKCPLLENVKFSCIMFLCNWVTKIEVPEFDIITIMLGMPELLKRKTLSLNFLGMPEIHILLT